MKLVCGAPTRKHRSIRVLNVQSFTYLNLLRSSSMIVKQWLMISVHGCDYCLSLYRSTDVKGVTHAACLEASGLGR